MVAQKVILSQLNRKVPELKQKFSVRKIGLFGSIVRNKADKQSDIDILVDLAEPTFDHYMDLKFYLEKLFNRSVDLVMADTIKPRIKPVIEQEVIYAEGL
jgi:predicted nucleotidyltransferase